MPFSSPISLLVEALTVDGLTPGLRVTTDGTEPSAHTFSSEITGPIQLNFSSNAIVKSRLVSYKSICCLLINTDVDFGLLFSGKTSFIPANE